jgi:hypothetical protein
MPHEPAIDRAIEAMGLAQTLATLRRDRPPCPGGFDQGADEAGLARAMHRHDSGESISPSGGR